MIEDHDSLDFLVEAERDGALDADQQARLAAADPAELAAARQRAEALASAFAAARVDVPAGFVEGVLGRLPAVPPWQVAPAAAAKARRLSAWALPLAALLLFTLGGGLLAGGALLDSPTSQVGGAVFDFVVAVALAGAGLAIPASAGAALADLWAMTGTSLAVFAILALGVDLGFFLLLRRRPAAVRVDDGSPARRG